MVRNVEPLYVGFKMGKQYLWDQTTHKVRMARDKMQAS